MFFIIGLVCVVAIGLGVLLRRTVEQLVAEKAEHAKTRAERDEFGQLLVALDRTLGLADTITDPVVEFLPHTGNIDFKRAPDVWLDRVRWAVERAVEHELGERRARAVEATRAASAKASTGDGGLFD